MKQCLFCGRPITWRARIWRFFWGPLWCGIPFITYTPGSSILVSECCSWSCCNAWVTRKAKDPATRLLMYTADPCQRLCPPGTHLRMYDEPVEETRDE